MSPAGGRRAPEGTLRPKVPSVSAPIATTAGEATRGHQGCSAEKNTVWFLIFAFFGPLPRKQIAKLIGGCVSTSVFWTAPTDHSPAKAVILQRQPGSDHSYLVIYRQEIPKFPKHDCGPHSSVCSRRLH